MSFFPQLFVASSPPCGFPSGPITREVWCPLASPCIRAGLALHFVFWEAVWSPAVQWTPLPRTPTTTDSTTPNRAPPILAPPPLTTPKVLMCELRDYCSDYSLSSLSPLFLVSTTSLSTVVTLWIVMVQLNSNPLTQQQGQSLVK